MPDCHICDKYCVNNQLLYKHFKEAHGRDTDRVINEAPSDVQYQWTTLEGQRSRSRGKARPRHPYAHFALDNQACDVLNPTPVLPQLQALPQALPAPTGTQPWEVDGVFDPVTLFGNKRTFNFCQLMVQARLSKPHMDAFIMDQHANIFVFSPIFGCRGRI